MRIPLSLLEILLVLFGLHFNCHFYYFEQHKWQHSHFHFWLHQHWYLIYGCVFLFEDGRVGRIIWFFLACVCVFICVALFSIVAHASILICDCGCIFFLVECRIWKINLFLPCDYCQHCHLCSSIKHFCIYIDSMQKFVFYYSRYLGLNSLPIYIGIGFSISIYVAFLIYHWGVSNSIITMRKRNSHYEHFC